METEDTKIARKLRDVGIVVESVYDLVNTSMSYPEAIPILLEALKTGIEHDGTKEGVIRALTVKEAKGVAGPVLIREFYRTVNPTLRWTIGNAMTMVATDEDFDEMIRIIEDTENGDARKMFIFALGNFKNGRSENILLGLLEKNDLPGHAISALEKLKSEKARKYLISYQSHPVTWIRKAAARALKKLDKSESKPRNK
jgi:HEAT repeat protein